MSVPPEEFADAYWGRRPLLSRGGDHSDLFSLDAADELLSRRGLRTPFVRLARDGEVIDPARWTGPAGAGAEIADQVVDERVMRLHAEGATIVLQALHRIWPPLLDFGQQLAADLGHPVQINAYVTPPANQGFAAHYDVHDVFVLQIAGRKRWRIHEPVLAHPLRTQGWNDRSDAVARRAAEEPTIDTVLAPGDALYLPRGWLHSAVAMGGTSAHLTVGMHPITRHALIEALADLATEVPELRESLPLGAADLPTVGALSDWLGRVDQGLLTRALQERVWPQLRSEPIAPLAQARAVDDVGPTTVVRLRHHLPHHYESGVLRLTDRTITFPAACDPALKTLLAGAPIRVGELPGLDPDDGVTLVRRLLREAVCVPV